MVRKKVFDTIQKNKMINSGDTVVIGLSGGPDSVCLFNVLLSLKDELDIGIEAVHINHQLRPIAAEEDQEYVESICRDNGVRCWTFSDDCNKVAKLLDMTSEEAGRKMRYDAYAKVGETLVEEGALPDKVKIVTAHNQNDQRETLLFRLLRGTGTDGLAGMDYLRRDRLGFLIIRPLLDVPRNEIEEYCDEKNLSPRIDQTNKENIYTRNKIRLDLIPYLEENYNPNVTAAIDRLGYVAKEDKDCLWRIATSAFEEANISNQDGVCSLNRDMMKGLEPAIRHRVILKALEKVGLYKDISYPHMVAADKLIDKGNTPAQIEFPSGFRMRINYGKVEIYPEENGGVEPIKCKLKVSILYKKDYIYKEGTAIFDVDKMAEVYDIAGGPLTLIFARTREAGDYMTLSVGRKTIQDLFVDMKIPKNLRDSIYMAAIGNEILWIPEGLTRARYSDNFKVTAETERVLILEMDCEL